MIPPTNITPEELEIIENYLADKLSAEDLQQFEERLSSDGEWKQKLAEVRLLITGIREAALSERMSDYHQSAEDDLLPLKQVRSVQWSKIWMVAASIVLIVTTTLLFLRPSAGEKLFTDYFNPDPGLATTMSNSAGAEYTFMKGMVDYKTGNYKAALGNWKPLLTAKPAGDTLNYFIGCALLADGNASESLPYFKAVSATGSGPFLKDALWYEGLAWLKMGKVEEARLAITASRNENAGALLDKIR